jgi:hypothetical protein
VLKISFVKHLKNSENQKSKNKKSKIKNQKFKKNYHIWEFFFDFLIFDF